MRLRGTKRAIRRAARRTSVVVCAVTLGVAGTAYGTHVMGFPGTALDDVITGNPNAAFSFLTSTEVDPDAQHVVRDGSGGSTKVPAASPNREDVRQSLAYFAQFTDFQLADEESPSRVEFLDPDPSGTASAAYRPQESFVPFEVDATVRKVNEFVPASPISEGAGTHNAMDFALMTGDNADSMQRNETVWVKQLLEGTGGPINFNSGRTDLGYYSSPQFLAKPSCLAYLTAEGGDPTDIVAEAARYTGVQDYSDYNNNPLVEPNYYDPNSPEHQYSAWPQWTGLMDRAAQLSITPDGLDVATYVTNGNHDALVQGNEDATAAYEDIGTACRKPLLTSGAPDPADGLQNLLDPNALVMSVPPDPARRYVSRPQIRQIFSTMPDGGGFDFVDPAEATASTPPAPPADALGSAASYYSWDPPETDGRFRFISIDTNSEGGVVGASANGNIDHPQFQWLEGELAEAQAQDRIVVIFGHHPVGSLSFPTPDEAAPQCVGPDSVAGPPDTLPPHDNDTPPHDLNPGCDLDPRPSTPIHLGDQNAGGESFVSLLDRHPNVIAYVAGHTHRHNLDVFERTTDDSAWWSIETSAVVDWPTQSRLVEVMDNRDDTLSIFGTLIDHASDAEAPASGTNACGATPSCSDGDGFDTNDLASIGRTLSYNDPQGGPPSGEGPGPGDRNAELLLFDPREADLSLTKVDAPDPVDVGDPLTYTLTVTNEDDPADVSGANEVVVTDDLPLTADFVSAIPSVGTCNTPAGDEDLVCDLGDLASGAVATVTVTVTPQIATTITNTATVESIFNDPIAGNDSVQQDTTVNPGAGSADLQITKTDSPDPVTAGEQLTYSVSVSNNGPNTAFAAFTDQLPSGTTFVSASAPGGCELDLGTVTCLIGTLANGASATATIRVIPQLAGQLFNQANVLSSLADPTAANNTEGESTQVNPRTTPVSGSCRGVPATIVGTGSGETTTGTAGADVIVAGDGDDTVLARGGRDLVCGGSGNDGLFGGKGRDRLFGEAGNDRIRGGKGRDRARGGPGKDRCTSAKHQGCQGPKPKPKA